MTDEILRLYPDQQSVSLEGLYLRTPLLPPEWNDRIFVYSNFITSIDGRIAVSDSRTGHGKVPPDIANPRDWRLFQELAAQADVLLTSGRYLRDLRDGRAQDVLPISSKPPYADLLPWRAAHGMASQPDVAVMSGRLDFELPQRLLEQGRRVMIFTGAHAQDTQVQRLRAQGAEVIAFGHDTVPAADMVRYLEQEGYRRLYSVTGPQVLQGLVAADVLDALFVTTVHRLIGGSPATTLLEGELSLPVDFGLSMLYFDSNAKGKNLGQSLARYDRKR
jgi:riboflavin biosynthesis pyrimidine reductase